MTHATIEELGPGPWWFGHEHPERPPDDFCAWSWDCDPCTMHLVAAAAREPGVVAHHVDTGTKTITTLAYTLECAREWRADHGLRAL
jgi:hypothetical protein